MRGCFLGIKIDKVKDRAGEVIIYFELERFIVGGVFFDNNIQFLLRILSVVFNAVVE